MKPASSLINTLRGFLIGTAEVIPGVSGGTIALIVGVYETIISGISDFGSALGYLVRGKTTQALASFKKIRFAVLLPILFGMLVAIFAAAAVLEPLIESEPELVRAGFAGMLIASFYVPAKMIRASVSVTTGVAILAGAALAFWLTSLPNAGIGNPSWWQIILFAALAVCALVLPGVSGSFFLLAVGMYAPTIAAVNERSFGYLGLFVVGAVAGLLVFARAVEWFLLHHRGFTLSLMLGLMIGSLRALWPWQSADRELLPVSDPGLPLLALVIGLLIVVVTIIAEHHIRARATQ